MQTLATQVEEAVAQARFLRILLIAKHRHRQFGSFRQNLYGLNAHLDVTSRQVGVFGLVRAGDHFAIDLDNAFGTQALDSFKARRFGVQDQLGQTVVVAQVDEQQAAVVALAAGMGAVGVHYESFKQ